MREWLSKLWKPPAENKDPPKLDNPNEDKEFQRFSHLLDNAVQRLIQDDQSRRQQKIIFLIGQTLSISRLEVHDLTPDLLAQKLGITTQDLLYAELGILEPERFLALMDTWTGILHINTFDLLHEAEKLISQE